MNAILKTVDVHLFGYGGRIMADEIFDVSEEYERIVAEHYTKNESIALQKFLNRDKLVRNIIQKKVFLKKWKMN